jgi:hypothetical protein
MVIAGRDRGTRAPPRRAREEEAVVAAGLDEREGRRDAGESATSEAISPVRWAASGGEGRSCGGSGDGREIWWGFVLCGVRRREILHGHCHL